MTTEKPHAKGTTLLTKGEKGRRNYTPICYPKKHCLEERQKYGSQLYPVCPALKEFISKEKLYDPADIPNSIPPTLRTVMKVLDVCGGLIKLRPSQEVIALCAHRDNFLSEWLEPIRGDLETLPTRLEKDYPDTSKKCRALFDELRSVEQTYSDLRNNFAYLLPPKTEEPNWAQFLAWRQSKTTLAKPKGMLEVLTMSRLTCSYPVKAVRVARKIDETLTPLITILATSSDKGKETEGGTITGSRSVAELAEHYKVNQENLRKRLDRFRAKNALDPDLFIESQNRGKNKPKYLYDAEKVLPIIEKLKNKKTSVIRKVAFFSPHSKHISFLFEKLLVRQFSIHNHLSLFVLA